MAKKTFTEIMKGFRDNGWGKSTKTFPGGLEMGLYDPANEFVNQLEKGRIVVSEQVRSGLENDREFFEKSGNNVRDLGATTFFGGFRFFKPIVPFNFEVTKEGMYTKRKKIDAQTGEEKIAKDPYWYKGGGAGSALTIISFGLFGEHKKLKKKHAEAKRKLLKTRNEKMLDGFERLKEATVKETGNVLKVLDKNGKQVGRRRSYQTMSHLREEKEKAEAVIKGVKDGTITRDSVREMAHSHVYKDKSPGYKGRKGKAHDNFYELFFDGLKPIKEYHDVGAIGDKLVNWGVVPRLAKRLIKKGVKEKVPKLLRQWKRLMAPARGDSKRIEKKLVKHFGEHDKFNDVTHALFFDPQEEWQIEHASENILGVTPDEDLQLEQRLLEAFHSQKNIVRQLRPLENRRFHKGLPEEKDLDINFSGKQFGIRSEYPMFHGTDYFKEEGGEKLWQYANFDNLDEYFVKHEGNYVNIKTFGLARVRNAFEPDIGFTIYRFHEKPHSRSASRVAVKFKYGKKEMFLTPGEARQLTKDMQNTTWFSLFARGRLDDYASKKIRAQKGELTPAFEAVGASKRRGIKREYRPK